MTKLLDQGLLKEVRVKRGEPHWRVDENERPIGLKLTKALCSEKSSTTLDDMVVVTGWLPHTTRAALTGLRNKGYELAKEKNAGRKTVYRIEKAGAA